MILFRGGCFNTILKDTLETYLEKLRKKDQTLQASLKSDSHLFYFL